MESPQSPRSQVAGGKWALNYHLPGSRGVGNCPIIRQIKQEGKGLDIPITENIQTHTTAFKIDINQLQHLSHQSTLHSKSASPDCLILRSITLKFCVQLSRVLLPTHSLFNKFMLKIVFLKQETQFGKKKQHYYQTRGKSKRTVI